MIEIVNVGPSPAMLRQGPSYQRWRPSFPANHNYKKGATQAITSGALWALGDVFSQKIEGRKKIDFKRSLVTAGYGAVFIGPVGHGWYVALDKFARARFRIGSPAFIATKVVLDEGLFGPIHVLGFFAYMTLAEGGTWEDVKRKCKNDFWSAYAAELVFWPAFQAVNFWKVPLRHQLLAVNLACLLDATFLCWIQQQDDWTKMLPGWRGKEATTKKLQDAVSSA
ncbi:hypothetical protein WJX75_000679 [Coccomyxa subellipsoidea]|uniref:Uncharacterized protein n=1 Tax=Coccomyxa subellipsoidea TaxID=248742 RepID=A0ABR2YWV9_9CHLO